jgi:hypothetical protein
MNRLRRKYTAALLFVALALIIFSVIFKPETGPVLPLTAVLIAVPLDFYMNFIVSNLMKFDSTQWVSGALGSFPGVIAFEVSFLYALSVLLERVHIFFRNNYQNLKRK